MAPVAAEITAPPATVSAPDRPEALPARVGRTDRAPGTAAWHGNAIANADTNTSTEQGQLMQNPRRQDQQPQDQAEASDDPPANHHGGKRISRGKAAGKKAAKHKARCDASHVNSKQRWGYIKQRAGDQRCAAEKGVEAAGREGHAERIAPEAARAHQFGISPELLFSAPPNRQNPGSVGSASNSALEAEARVVGTERDRCDRVWIGVE